MSPALPNQLGFTQVYLLDANIFIAAWLYHYPIDRFPEFWDSLRVLREEGKIRSVDEVDDEITGPPELVAWIEENWQRAFLSTKVPAVAEVFSQMQTWVDASARFRPQAKNEFALKADGWLAAYAKVHNGIVVTNEVLDNNARRRVPIPNLCREFDIEYCDTIGMLRRLDVTFPLR